MGICQPIHGLKFDSLSKALIKQIKSSGKMKSLLQGSILVGSFHSIFVTDVAGGIGGIVTIKQTDWKLLADALKGTNALSEGIIRRNISYGLTTYMNDNSNNGQKLYRFWEGLENGCRL